MRYNIFEDMRKYNISYGWRQDVEADVSDLLAPDHFGDWMRSYLDQFHPITSAFIKSSFGIPRRFYYNNFFVSKVSWWRSEEVTRFRKEFDKSNQIYVYGSGDLLFQSTAVQLFMPRINRKRYLDFSYYHHTRDDLGLHGGGMSIAQNDPRKDQLITNYLEIAGEKKLRVVKCENMQSQWFENGTDLMLTEYQVNVAWLVNCHKAVDVDFPIMPPRHYAPPDCAGDFCVDWGEAKHRTYKRTLFWTANM